MDLEAFLKEVLAPVLDFPDELEVEVEKSGRQVDVSLRAPKADRGRIIGRNGKMISSLRTLCRAAGDKQGLSVNLELVEDDLEYDVDMQTAQDA
jgi:predicted RNA-binding protein YlqC (UPF0109 family)